MVSVTCRVRRMILLFILSCLLALSEANMSKSAMGDIPEDANRNFTELAMKYGHDCEEFNVFTDDGYILKVFHIKGNEGKKPVLLMHGILDSSDTFILRGNISIAISLADEGYDVWAGNARGNRYSVSNLNLSPVLNKEQFWDFSFHNLGVSDLPAIIDFVLEKTGKSSLAAVGHSQGTSMFFVLGSMKPEYNKKVSVFIALAPIAYLSHVNPALFLPIIFHPLLSHLLKSIGMEQIMQDHTALKNITSFVCSQGLLGYALCEEGIMGARVIGDVQNLEPEFLRVTLGHFPAGTSRKSLVHYAQVAKNDRFAQFDYDDSKNMELYNSTTPPAYDLKNADIPIALVVGRNDGISSVKDVERLKSELPNVVDYHEVEHDYWNHGDHVWAKTIDVHIVPYIKKILAQYAK